MISLYLLIGLVICAFFDIVSKLLKNESLFFSNKERIAMILLWPIVLTVSFISLLKKMLL